MKHPNNSRTEYVRRQSKAASSPYYPLIQALMRIAIREVREERQRSAIRKAEREGPR